MIENYASSGTCDALNNPQSDTLQKTIKAPIRFFVIATLVAFALSFTYAQSANITAFYLARQDRWLLLLGTGVVALSYIKLSRSDGLPNLTRKAALCGLAVIFLLTFAGHYLILSGYDHSRDEQMASFDAAVFFSGHLVQPLPAFWREHAGTLNVMFMYPAEQRGAWISSYLPFNAGLRALLSIVGAPTLAGPLMTVLGGVALWGTIRRLWPDDKEALTVGLMLYAGSAQILATGMTSYAMPAHLALNLCWLWLFLRGSWTSDIAALLVGFIAVGLHQPLMHPIFVAPILLLLVRERRWDRAALYFAGYAAIGTFWLLWPNFIWQMVQADPVTLRPDGVDYMTRLTQVLSHGDPLGLPNMASNMLRLIAWQHLLLVPLMLIGAQVARADRLAGALAGGIVLTIFAMAALLPYQGHGFGYRYLHGLIGNAILLAIFGWRSVAKSAEIGKWRDLMWRTTVVGGLVLLPVQGWMAYNFYAAPAEASKRIDKIDADYAVIGGADTRDAYDLIYNPPALNRRPVRLLRQAMVPAAIRDICASGPTVALVGNQALRPLADFYEKGTPGANLANSRMAPRLAAAGCRVMPSMP